MSRFKNLIKKVYYNKLSLLSRKLDSRSSILDVGCGYSSSIRLVRKGSYRVGLDFYKPYILKSKKSLIHDDYVLGDAKALPFKPNSFDCGVAIEVLEHLPKHEGAKMIAEMERVARKIILTTPNGFLPTYPGPDDNPHERHLSGWTVNELKKLGFQVYGGSGFKVFWRVKQGKVMLKRPEKLFVLLAGISQLFFYHYPSLASQLFCVKAIKL